MSDVWPRYIRACPVPHVRGMLNDFLPQDRIVDLPVKLVDRVLDETKVTEYVSELQMDLLSKEEEVEIQGETIYELRQRVAELEAEVGTLQARSVWR